MTDLVEPRGTAPRIALWDHPLEDPNLEDARFPHALDGLAKVPGLRAVEGLYRRKLRHKTWQYMTACSDEIFVAFVIGTAGFAGNAFVYAVELPGGAKHEHFAITPLSAGVSLAKSSTGGKHEFGASGLAIGIENLDGGRRFAAHIASKKEITASLAFTSEPTDEHFSLCVPLPGGRWNYTHKYGAFAVTGHVVAGGRRFELSPGKAFGTLDFTKMYALRHAVWRWVAIAGRTRRGNVIGLNLVDPTPNGEDPKVHENCAWIDGKREPLAHVHLTPTTVAADSVDLNMREVARVDQRLNAPLLKHHLQHVVGAFSGHVRTKSGQIHDIEELVGIAEANDTWW